MEETYRKLRALMLASSPGMTVFVDAPEKLVFNAPWNHPSRPDEPVFFGAVRLSKTYVGYHLMPVYSHPALLDGISPALEKRMQGKSCFNFKRDDPALFAELGELTRRCARLYASRKTPTKEGPTT